jgi:hypothetical protein
MLARAETAVDLECDEERLADPTLLPIDRVSAG